MDPDAEDVVEPLTDAIERLNQIEDHYRQALQALGMLDEERDAVLAETDAVRRMIRKMCDILVARGHLEPGHTRLIERVGRATTPAGQLVRLRVLEDDKHQIAGADIDCASRLHLCRARCCALHVDLSHQDIADGIKWNVDEPYVLLRGADGWCHHLDRDTGGCGVYDVRPAMCRRFDCRKDPRIWVDFEAGIPAPAAKTRISDTIPPFAVPKAPPER